MVGNNKDKLGVAVVDNNRDKLNPVLRGKKDNVFVELRAITYIRVPAVAAVAAAATTTTTGTTTTTTTTTGTTTTTTTTKTTTTTVVVGALAFVSLFVTLDFVNMAIDADFHTLVTAVQRQPMPYD